MPLLPETSARAQQREDVTALNAEVVRLYRAGKFREAIPIAERAIAAAEASQGRDHPSLRRLLENLASLYEGLGRHADAEPLYRRSLVIAQKTSGAERADVADLLNKLAAIYEALGRVGDAEQHYLRSFAILERVHARDHAEVARTLNNLAGLYRDHDRFAEAEPLYKRALEALEKSMGPQHAFVGIVLNNFALLQHKQGRLREAELLYTRSLSIHQKAHGTNHPGVGRILSNLAAVHRSNGRHADAEQLLKQALAISEKASGPEHPNVAHSLNNLAVLYENVGRLQEAEALHKRALGIHEKALGPAHPDVANSLANLAALYEVAGRLEEAETLHKRSLAIREAALGRNHSEVAHSLEVLGSLYITRSRHAEAELVLARALSMREGLFGSDSPNVTNAVALLARLRAAQGRIRESEQFELRALSIRERALGPDHPDVGMSLNNLAERYRVAGRHAEAEALYKRSLAIHEKASAGSTQDFAAVLNNLALLFVAQGRQAEAEPLYRRSLAISEKTFGPEHAEVANKLSNLAGLYKEQGRYSEAESLLTRALAIKEKVLRAEHPGVAATLNILAGVYKEQRRHAEAEPLYKRSLNIRETVLGRDHPDVGVLLNNIAVLLDGQGRFREAEPYYQRAHAIVEAALGHNHPYTGGALGNLAGVVAAQGEWARAADLAKRSTAVIERRAALGLAGTVQSEARQMSDRFAHLVKVSHQVALQEPARRNAIAREMLATAQWAVTSEAASSLTQMAARTASGSAELTALVREHQDLAAELQASDNQFIAAMSAPTSLRHAPTEKALGERIAAIEARLSQISARFAKDFPDYAALSRPTPVTIDDVQASLGSDEALVLFLDTAAATRLPEETFVWVVTRTAERWIRSDLGTAALVREVAALRCGLDATAWYDAGAKRCGDLLNLQPDKAPKPGEPLPFDASRAHALYVSLLGDVRDLIKGKHLLVVPSGALTTLPFQVLVAEPPKSNDLAVTHWLVRDHAITVLPSASSLKSLRRISRPSGADLPMIGFANPLLDGRQADPVDGPYFKDLAQKARGQSGCSASTGNRTASLRRVKRGATTLAASSGLAALAEIRRQSPLPETADEVCEVARSVGANVSEMRIGAAATETAIKALSRSGELARYRIVHFATHGLLAGQLSGAREPGLILSPQTTATAEDDAYLSASEIAALKLDADWVILSACNTAGGTVEGEAAEALSGLARVFFYAGVRAVLVSHWEVDSDAAVKLVTGAVGALAKESSLGRAEVLRRAVMTVMTDNSRPTGWIPAWHPSVWASFVVVGEGGAGR